MTVLIAALILAGSSPVARDIDAFCHSVPACVAKQRESLRHFLGLSVMFDPPQPTMQQCMVAGKTGKAVDWTVAERCLRDWSKGRKSVLPGGANRR